MPDAIVITTAGINCDRELAEAFELAGATAELVHLNRLLEKPQRLDRYDLIGLPGGFSYGDAVAAGRIAAQLMRRRLYRQLVRSIERGVPVIAPCNGFQIVVQIGLLPGPAVGQPWPEEPPAPGVALARNAGAAGGRFVDRWVRVEYPAATRCVWTAGLDAPDPDQLPALLPIAHAEGRFAADAATIGQLAESGQVAVRYAADDNPNGSAGAIAGICDASGVVLGLMPHPERYTRWTSHPWWTRLGDAGPDEMTPGLAMFRNAVAHAERVAI